jgi:PAS domain S-box-containing protein
MDDESKTREQLLEELIDERRERRRLQTTHSASEQWFHRLVERATDMIYHFELLPDFRVVYINPAFEAITGYEREDIYADADLVLANVHPDDQAGMRGRRLNALPSIDEPFNYRMILPSGDVIWIEECYIVLKDEHGSPVAIEGIAHARTRQVSARIALQRSHDLKTLLLREMHHRIKNDLTLVGSLLQLQAAKSDSPEVREMIAVSQQRLLCVAGVHDALYQSESLNRVNLKTYILRLGDAITALVGSDRNWLHFELEDTHVPLREAVQYGIIINELITNALKHAFPSGFVAGPSVLVRLQRMPGALTITVSDNGDGLPARLKPAESPTLGLQIVHLLTEQLGGTVEYASQPGHGTCISVAVPATEATQ